MKSMRKTLPGLALTLGVAVTAFLLNQIIPGDFLGMTLIALIVGMALNPFVEKYPAFAQGIHFTSGKVLRLGIILTGINLSFFQVAQAGKYALLLLAFTFTTAFSVGIICSKVFHINWKLSSLLSVSTAICGGTAVATLGPTIGAKDRDIAYAISATFLFDLITVLLFPWFGKLLGMTDTGYGLWIGTAVNDTSSVVAAGYAFSDPAGALATIVKLTRTLFIVPVVIVFSWINSRKEAKSGLGLSTGVTSIRRKISFGKIFPWFILGFLVMVGIRSLEVLPLDMVNAIANVAKVLLAMALGAIGMKTSLGEVKEVGIKPMVAGVIIDTSVVIVALFAQGMILSWF